MPEQTKNTEAKAIDRAKGLITRRNTMIAGAAIAVAGTMSARKRDLSGPRDDYFLSMQKAMRDVGISTPTLVIDRTRLNHNIDVLMRTIPTGMGYRIVSKSLPSVDLIAHIRQRSGTSRLMTFNLPMLTLLSQQMPGTDQLVGKPLPIVAARSYIQSGQVGAAAKSNVQWLIDSPRRLDEYAQVARAHNEHLRVNIELDVGLHRGGVTAGEQLTGMLQAIKDNPNLTFAGFMGYEPHLIAIAKGGKRDKFIQKAWTIYNDALSAAREVFGGQAMQNITRNAAGSPTYAFYKDTSIANEISVGTALVKPSHYDMDTLTEHLPASFIATPVIKHLDGNRIPTIEALTGIRRAFNPNIDQTYFIYGGHWLADPVDPPGLQYSGLFGRSSNQEMLTGGPGIDLKPDDFVFFRPHQSEAVFLQFGDIAIYENGRIVDFWPVFPASA